MAKIPEVRMRFSELLDYKKKFDVYEFGQAQDIKLYDDSVPKETVIEEFNKTKAINEIYEASLKVIDHIAVEDRYGIIFEHVEGDSALSQAELEPSLAEDLVIESVAIQVKMHRTIAKNLPPQKTYFKNEINKCEVISDAVKSELLDLVKTLPTAEMLCHGNFHLDNVFNNGQVKIFGFEKAYKGHPISDVASTCLIYEIPRTFTGGSEAANMILENKQVDTRDTYLQAYETMTQMDLSLLNQYKRIAAVLRLNEDKDGERDFLLKIINNDA